MEQRAGSGGIAQKPRRNTIIVAVVIVFLAAVGLAVVYFQRPAPDQTADALPDQPVETEEEKADRLTVMNMLNAFVLEMGALSDEGLESDARMAREVEAVSALEARLGSFSARGDPERARRGLVDLTHRWGQYLNDRQNTQELRQPFIELANDYPWLNALVWLIVLHRL